MKLGLEQVAAHYAISSVFSSFAEETDLFCYRVRRISYDISDVGPWKAGAGAGAYRQRHHRAGTELLVCGACTSATRILPRR